MDAQIKEIAIEAANVGGAILTKYFRAHLTVEIKDELSPLVSKADREAEFAMREVISNAFPTHAIRGEEFDDFIPEGNSNDPITWTIDPLDGTTAYLSGMPTFVVLIGVWQGNEPLLGVIYQPLTKDMWVGDGTNTTLNEKIISVADYPNQPFIIATTSPDYLSKATLKAFDEMRKQASVTHLGGDGHLYGSLACGRLGLIVEEGLKWHDVAALVPVIEGAGGRVTEFSRCKIQPGKNSYTLIASVSKTLQSDFISILKKNSLNCGE